MRQKPAFSEHSNGKLINEPSSVPDRPEALGFNGNCEITELFCWSRPFFQLLIKNPIRQHENLIIVGSKLSVKPETGWSRSWLFLFSASRVAAIRDLRNRLAAE